MWLLRDGELETCRIQIKDKCSDNFFSVLFFLLIAGELELINLQMDCGGVKMMMFVMIMCDCR